jgi:4-hydroxybenzoyl-CoA thioesterase
MSVDYEFKVRWGDTDAAGIVFYPNFYKWMNEATHEFFAKIGLPASTLFEEEQIAIPLLETHCEFKSPLLFEDIVNIRSSVVEVRNKVFKMSHQFYRGDQLIAEGYEVRAWTLFKDKPKAQPIPDNIREKMLFHYLQTSKV